MVSRPAAKGRAVCQIRHHDVGPTLSNGAVGEAAGFSILKSNNVPNTSGDKVQDHRRPQIATAYVEQILDLQTYKPEKRFGDAVKGLHVYGAKVVRPIIGAACLIANKT